MTPAEFIAKWHNNPLKERASYQLHFLDLCDLVGAEKPSPQSEHSYCFERGATRTGAGHGWADVWKQGVFAFEYKANGKNLDTALKQLMTYALALDNPPLLVVCDTDVIQIHTHFTGTPSQVHTIALSELGNPENLNKLNALFHNPDYFRPKVTTHAVTIEAANKLGKIADRLNSVNDQPQKTAHFLIQCVFCMFAEDAKLLPEKLFETVLDKSNPDGSKAQARLSQLFHAMQSGGEFALIDIPWFNGGLFVHIDVPMLTTPDVVELLAAARMDWRAIEPAILGTLFERGLNPAMRSQLGAHYTDPETINKIIDPVIVQPLNHAWQQVKAEIAQAMQAYHEAGKSNQKSRKAYETAHTLMVNFIEQLKAFRVLDPACGSGNFLYLSLKALKDFEHRINIEAEALGLQRQLGIETSPENVMGIEINPYAAELARVTVWIGEIQWMLDHGYALRTNPILQTLDHIVQQDALIQIKPVILEPSPPVIPAQAGIHETNAIDSRLRGNDDIVSETQWPACTVIVGNPPFLGDKKMLSELGEDYTTALRKAFKGRVAGGADLVTYWFEKARDLIEKGQCLRAGLVATNSIRQKTNRQVLSRIIETTQIFNTWSDEPWVNAGAAVRVSLVCFGHSEQTSQLNGQPVNAIFADLTAQTESTDNSVDITTAKPLTENAGWSYFGLCLAGAFKIPTDLALSWLTQPNPNGRPNSDVIKPIYNGSDVTSRWGNNWVIDFASMTEDEASLYEMPFAYILEHVKPVRLGNARKARAERWWQHGETRPGLRKKTKELTRYIATPETAKHRFFVWLPVNVAPEHRLVVIPRDDDTTFGILTSRIHVVWVLAIGGTLEDRPVYNSTLCFTQFPFPQGLTPADSAALASSPLTPNASRITTHAQKLNELRTNWLNPTEWVDWVRTAEEEKAGFPLRPVAKVGFETELKKRTLTNLYNAMPAWLQKAHAELDKAVATAYGWADYTAEMPDAEILARLLRLNEERSRMSEKSGESA